jgi:pimeloyl-ACP methyl ester carboxylesterase
MPSAIYKSADGARAVQARYQLFLRDWPVTNKQLRVPTRYGETFLVASGPDNAPPLLLLHGAGANAAMWMNDVAALAAHFRVYAVDIIGEPGLSAPERPPLASEAYALWLDDVMQALSITRTSIVAVSLGGWLALDYATRRPHRVESLVLLCPSGVGRQKMGFLFKAIPLLMLGRWGRRKAMDMVAGPPPGDATPADRDFADLVLLIFEHFRPRVMKIPIFSDEALKRLTMPLMAIVGGNDVLLDSAATKQRLERIIPHAKVRYLPEAGHILRDQTGPIPEFLRNSKSWS